MGDGGTHRFSIGDAGYPAGLMDLQDPPRALVLRGQLRGLPSDAVAIVGARAATPYGMEFARRLAADLGRLGVLIVSGLARGIDAAAHRGALEAGGLTAAVLPAGIGQMIPPGNTELARTIAASGTLVSEWEEDRPVYRGMFLERNRLIAALTRATVVVEAAERSGALATAAIARRLGRRLLAVPGDVDRPTSRGANALLRKGADVCESAADVVRALGGVRAGGALEASRLDAELAHALPATPYRSRARVLEALADGPLGLEPLAARSGVTPGSLLEMLIELEWAGLVTTLPGQRWTKRGAAA